MRPSTVVRAKEFLVTILDKANADRMKFRGTHMKNIPASIGSPIKNAGAILGENGKLIGSHYNLKVDSEADIVPFLKKDIYAKEGVWDFDTIQIKPILIATREEKIFEN